MTTKPDRIPEPEPVHPRRPARSEEHDPLQPHPDHDLPGAPEPPHKAPPPPTPAPKTGREARDVTAPPAAALTALLPTSAAIGDPSFVVRAIGSGFTPTSLIVFAGNEEPTTFVSDEELTTGVNMDVWHGPDPAIPVLVRTDGVDTEVQTFAFTEPRPVPLDVAHASKPIPLMDLITPV